MIKKLLPRTLFGRSLLILVLPIFFIQVISTFVFLDRHWSKMSSRLAFAVAGEIALISSYIENGNQRSRQEIFKLAEKRLDFKINYHDGHNLDLGSDNNAGAFQIWEAMVKDTLAQELALTIRKPFIVNVDFAKKLVEVRVQLEQGVLSVSLPQRRLFSSSTYIFLLWIFAASSILLIISVLFMRNQIRPIRRLAIAAERFGKGRDVKNFKIQGAREVQQAGKAFIVMKERLQRQISQRTDMLAGVSHDLRTPLTRLKLQVEMLGDSSEIEDMKNDISDMEKMIEGYLDFVRGEGSEASTITDIPEILQDITKSVKRQGCDVELNLNDISAYISLRPMAFKRCLNNIVGNAVKYADLIWITLEKCEDGQIRIIIEDNGEGIDPDKFDDVFKPFYRVDSSRNLDTVGVGLGLSIAMDIVHSHGGEIWLEKSTHGGVAVNITLPS